MNKRGAYGFLAPILRRHVLFCVTVLMSVAFRRADAAAAVAAITPVSVASAAPAS